MAIFYDITQALVTIHCEECRGVWHAAAWTRDEARERAAEHEANVHPDSFQVRHQMAKNERLRASRHAASRDPIPSMPQ